MEKRIGLMRIHPAQAKLKFAEQKEKVGILEAQVKEVKLGIIQ